jgi:hypothetical protein
MKKPSLKSRQVEPECLVAQLVAEPPALRAAVEGLSCAGSQKFRYSKALLTLSEQQPEVLYPYFSSFRRLMNADNRIIQWIAFRLIANLAPVDEKQLIAGIIDEYLAPIKGPVMITAATAIQGAVKIAAMNKPLTDKVVRAILKVERAQYQTDECRNIAIGHAINALGTLDEPTKRRKEVVGFVQRQIRNTRNATRKKAELFLMRIRA